MARMLIVCVLSMTTLFSLTATAQPGDRYLVMKAQVLAALFTLDVEPKPYFLKMVLRFGDSDTQLTVVVYPGRKSEVLRFRLADSNRGDLERLVSRAVTDNPQVKPQEIAAGLKVDVARSPVDYDAGLRPAIDELRYRFGSRLCWPVGWRLMNSPSTNFGTTRGRSRSITPS